MPHVRIDALVVSIALCVVVLLGLLGWNRDEREHRPRR